MKSRFLQKTGAIGDGQRESSSHGEVDADALVSHWKPDVRPAAREPKPAPFYGELRHRTIRRRATTPKSPERVRASTGQAARRSSGELECEVVAGPLLIADGRGLRFPCSSAPTHVYRTPN